MRQFVLSSVVAVVYAALLASSSGRACSICIGLPTETAADIVIASGCVLLAREDPKRPFSFAPIEVLKGRFDGEPIDLLVDSVTRRTLKADQTRHVVLAQEAPGGDWRRLGVTSAAYEAVLRRVLLLATEWKGEAGRKRRIEYFVSLFGDEDSAVHRLAYLELGRAPYPVIRKLGRRVKPEQIAPYLERVQYLEWRSLAILLEAHSSDPDVRRKIVERFKAVEPLGLTTNLAAWATAAIEVDQAAAIQQISDRYLSDPDRSEEELQAVLEALSLHGTEGHTHLRDEIVAAYSTLLQGHPELAGQVAKDLQAWDRFDLAPDMAKIADAEAGIDREGRRAIARYLQHTPLKQTALTDE